MSQPPSVPTPQQYTLKIEDQGRLTLPEEVRKQLDLQAGDRLILTITEDRTLQLVSVEHQKQLDNNSTVVMASDDEVWTAYLETEEEWEEVYRRLANS